MAEEDLLMALPLELVSGRLGAALGDELEDFEEEDEEDLDEEEVSAGGDEVGEEADEGGEPPDGHVYEVIEDVTQQYMAAIEAAVARYAPHLWVPSLL